MITFKQTVFICALLILSVILCITPIAVYLWRKFAKKTVLKKRKKSGFSGMLTYSLCLIFSIWCVRYAVGYHSIITFVPDELNTVTLSPFEEIFNSLNHALKTFSTNEEFTEYVLEGKMMLMSLIGDAPVFSGLYGIYVSILNFVAPIAGGAIVFEIIASIFPKIKLRLSYLAVWKEKYYFSELNVPSLALAKSVLGATKSKFFRPTIIFTDAYIDGDSEKDSEMLLEAQDIGAICVSDDLSHIVKNKWGLRKFLLMDEHGANNLHTLTDLANPVNNTYLKNSEICLFTNDESYLQVENNLRDKLVHDFGFEQNELPTIIPINSYRNFISAMLADDIPLYEPLIDKKRNSDGTVDLSVTILGSGAIGTEMFLATYWYGQMLNCNLTVNVVSQESEQRFWNKIDYINPEIRSTTKRNDPILKINNNGDYSDIYCKVNYNQCDVVSSEFVQFLNKDNVGNLLDTDYFFISLGTDERNLSAANLIRKFVGQYHISKNEKRRSVISYVIYDNDLVETLNRTKKYSFVNGFTDVYMCAVGSAQQIYSVQNVFMTKYEPFVPMLDKAYTYLKDRETRAKVHRVRMSDDYKYWANLSRNMHIKYKVFSLGLIEKSIFDFEGSFSPEYIDYIENAYNSFADIAQGKTIFGGDTKLHIAMLHKMAWLEHRRWNAFTRVKGFRHTSDYQAYAKKGAQGSYKQMDLKLHPCLVECDKKGIRAVINEKCEVDESTLFSVTDKSGLDLLDELSYKLYAQQLNDYDFKMYDYPNCDLV